MIARFDFWARQEREQAPGAGRFIKPALWSYASSMRPGQQNKRMRGRNRKGPNPLSRNYESNGPDVKVRGNAQHVADKYVQLARDASVSGDRILAESYLQHAEHYYRIVAAAQAQMPQPQPVQRADEPQDDLDGNGEDGVEASDGDNETEAEAETDEVEAPRRPRRRPRVEASDAEGEDGEAGEARSGDAGDEASAEGEDDRPRRRRPRRRFPRNGEDPANAPQPSTVEPAE